MEPKHFLSCILKKEDPQRDPLPQALVHDTDHQVQSTWVSMTSTIPEKRFLGTSEKTVRKKKKDKTVTKSHDSFIALTELQSQEQQSLYLKQT